MVKSTDIDKISEKLSEVISHQHSSFFSEFLTAYGFPKASITRALNDMASLGVRKCSIKQRLLYLECPDTDDIEREYLNYLEERKARERFVFVTDFKRILSKDMLSNKGLDIPFTELPDNYEFFLPWCGREVVEQEVENPADVKAASEMGHLFEIIQEYNKDNEELTERSLNIFLTRLLFCCFSDDTGIFKKNQFRESLRINTADDGSDTKDYLEGLFIVLNTKQTERGNIHPKYKDFPYVNGGLFRERTPIPNFDKSSRRKLLECSTVDWSGINPDIFGSMFQTVINPEQRRTLGQHYTSVTNIMKVLKPLFLDELNEELDRICEQKKDLDRDKKLNIFRERLGNIVVFDPACGSGNFLIIAYKELCHIEMRALKAYHSSEFPYLSIQLPNFYGIEIDDFPCEIARLALWLVQHQINLECWTTFGTARPTLPLTDSGNIYCGNALRLDWNEVCPVKDREVYIASNPPYEGSLMMSGKQVEEIVSLFPNNKLVRKFDYVTGWFMKAAKYISRNRDVTAAFVSTNSVNQGIQASMWLDIFALNVEISFAYKPFKWENNAKHKAAVIVTVIGLRINQNKECYVYDEQYRHKCNHINPYLLDADDIVVTDTNVIPQGLPKACFGNMFRDGGNLIMSLNEKESLLQTYPNAEMYLKPFIGSEEFINGKTRWCLWIEDKDLSEAYSIPPIKERIELVKEMRLSSKASSTRAFAQTSWKAAQICYQEKPAIIIPRVSSERRKYIPIGYLPAGTVISDLAYAIYDAQLWLFAILTSAMHMVWMRAVCGKLESRYRYSNTLVYNTFPFPQLTEGQKKQLEESAMRIIEARENHYEMTMAQLYNTDTMPDDLRVAHESNDLIVDRLFKRTGFENDEERLSELFRLYELNTKKNKGELL